MVHISVLGVGGGRRGQGCRARIRARARVKARAGPSGGHARRSSLHALGGSTGYDRGRPRADGITCTYGPSYSFSLRFFLSKCQEFADSVTGLRLLFHWFIYNIDYVSHGLAHSGRYGRDNRDRSGTNHSRRAFLGARGHRIPRLTIQIIGDIPFAALARTPAGKMANALE